MTKVVGVRFRNVDHYHHGGFHKQDETAQGGTQTAHSRGGLEGAIYGLSLIHI